MRSRLLSIDQHDITCVREPLLHRPGVVALAVAPVPVMPPLLELHAILLARPRRLPARAAVPLPRQRGHRLAVPVLVPLIPVLHAKRRVVPAVPVALAFRRRVRLAAVTVEDVVVVVVVAGPAPAPLVRVMMPVVVVAVVVGVHVTFRVLQAHAIVRRLRPEHVLPPVVEWIEESFLMEKPQEHCNCG